MWKCASRTLKATFRKSVLRSTTVLSTKVPQNKELHCLLKLAPALLEQCSRFYNFYRGNCENFSKEKKNREGPKEKKTSFLGGFDNNFFDALKWSGAFVLGYYLLQPFGYKRRDFYEDLKFYKQTTCHDTFLYLIDAVQIKPYNCVIPEVQASKSRKAKEKQFSEPTESTTQSDTQKFTGLEKAHQKVLGIISNWLGTQCMQTGKHEEALEYFTESANEGNAAGIFNLGICYEKGLGTDQNFQRAAELYQEAADLGHATAIYNLGVFYAQGIGGIKLNVDHARKLFRVAANLGQKDAAKALSLEKQNSGSEEVLNSEHKLKVGSVLNEFIYDNLLSQSGSDSPGSIDVCEEMKNSFFDYPDGKEIQSSLGSDSGVLDLSPHNESNILLV